MDRTPRQRIADLLTLAPMTTQQIAAVVKMSERQVEDHLGHIMKTSARDRSVTFVLHPSECKTAILCSVTVTASPAPAAALVVAVNCLPTHGTALSATLHRKTSQDV